MAMDCMTNNVHIDYLKYKYGHEQNILNDENRPQNKEKFP